MKLKADASCAFATSTDVRTTQLGRLNKGIDLVTVTVGGNDLNVIGVVAAGQPDPNTLACGRALAEAQATLASPALGASLVQTFSAIVAKAPRAQVIVTGYPHLFGAAFAADPVAQIVNGATDGLNATIFGAVQVVAASEADIGFVPVEFSGHALGDGVPGVNGFTPWLNTPGMPDMLHPNAAGYAAYAAAVAAAIHPKIGQAESEKPEMIRHHS